MNHPPDNPITPVLPVRHRKLGRTGMDVSTVGFGTWQIAGGRWRAGTVEERVELLRRALDLGVNVYDAAFVYGQYRDAEYALHSRALELLGRAFEGRRDRVHYCVKLGQFDETTHLSAYDPHRVVGQFQQALRSLRTDHIDVCLIHAPSLYEVESGRPLAVLETLKALCLVRAVGYSFENEPGLVRVALAQGVDVLMVQYNLLDTECDAELNQAARRGVGVLVGGPYKRGYLTGQYARPADLPDDDYWRCNRVRSLAKVEGLLARVSEYVDEFGSPRALRRAALGFVLAKPAVASAVVGHRSLAEIVENIESVHSLPSQLDAEAVEGGPPPRA